MKLFAVFILSLLMAASVAAQRSNIPAELVGNWTSGNVSLLQEQNVTTGQLTSSYGSTIGYSFSADGAFRFAGLMKSTMYGCTTTLWNDRRGRVTVAGDKITFTPTKDYWLNTNSCAPSSNKEKNKELEAKTYNFEIGTKEGREWLCMREVGKTEASDIVCYPRSKD